MYECPNCGGYNVLKLDEEGASDGWLECWECGYAWLEMSPDGWDEDKEFDAENYDYHDDDDDDSGLEP